MIEFFTKNSGTAFYIVNGFLIVVSIIALFWKIIIFFVKNSNKTTPVMSIRRKSFFHSLSSNRPQLINKIINIVIIVSLSIAITSIIYTYNNQYIRESNKQYETTLNNLYTKMEDLYKEVSERKTNTEGDILTQAENISGNENVILNNLRQEDENLLHNSLKEYKEIVALFQTEKDTVRIDLLDSGFYRYAIWGKRKQQTEKPDLVLMNGTIRSYEGTLYEFMNGARNTYEYMVWFSRDGEIGRLYVYHNDILIWNYEITNIIYKRPG
jgi:hypothetical protein